MGVYIKGMEMPTRCAECWLMDGEDSWCTACRGRHLGPEYRYGIKDRPGWCPLVPVPPHGRLIDADALMKEFEKAQRRMEQHGQEYSCSFLSSSREISTEWYCVEDMLENAPTVIEAEEGE